VNGDAWSTNFWFSVETQLGTEHREVNNMDILTVQEVAQMLKITKQRVYELANQKTRTGEVRQNPISVLRIGSSVRFRKSDVEAWIKKLVRR
jgi:excisionase family DNA binding protein